MKVGKFEKKNRRAGRGGQEETETMVEGEWRGGGQERCAGREEGERLSHGMKLEYRHKKPVPHNYIIGHISFDFCPHDSCSPERSW